MDLVLCLPKLRDRFLIAMGTKCAISSETVAFGVQGVPERRRWMRCGISPPSLPASHDRYRFPSGVAVNCSASDHVGCAWPELELPIYQIPRLLPADSSNLDPRVRWCLPCPDRLNDPRTNLASTSQSSPTREPLGQDTSPVEHKEDVVGEATAPVEEALFSTEARTPDWFQFREKEALSRAEVDDSVKELRGSHAATVELAIQLGLPASASFDEVSCGAVPRIRRPVTRAA